jgi:cell wall-associated NlpC family hydrolase
MKLPSLFTALFLLFSAIPTQAQLTPAQHQKLIETSRWLGAKRLGYASRWTPPGEKQSWVMDCSNTARYLYQTALNKSLSRTASDQFYDLSQQSRITLAPTRIDGSVDTAKLLKLMRSGDLLFWEWTYNIDRRPPITHVMIYLGTTGNGSPKMAGSASRSMGEASGSGGPDVYNFDPNGPMGGVRNSFGGYVHKARFVGFGRPL